MERLPPHLTIEHEAIEYKDLDKYSAMSNHRLTVHLYKAEWKPIHDDVLLLGMQVYGLNNVKALKGFRIFQPFTESALYSRCYSLLKCSSLKGLKGKGKDYDPAKIRTYFTQVKALILWLRRREWTQQQVEEWQEQYCGFLSLNSMGCVENSWPQDKEWQQDVADFYRREFQAEPTMRKLAGIRLAQYRLLPTPSILVVRGNDARITPTLIQKHLDRQWEIKRQLAFLNS
jgi:hypothetical protein